MGIKPEAASPSIVYRVLAVRTGGGTWVGLKANTLVGCFDQSGYIGLGEAPGAVLNNKATKSALIDAGECEGADSAGLDLLLKSFEFVH